ncbi:exported hypothetical protein [Candidatus Terasakiella magnetica]|nr:exported hypothetical protein [Candidatus Terasakiella magnetica]
MRLSRRTLLGAALTGGSAVAVAGALPALAKPVELASETLVLVDPSVSSAFSEGLGRVWVGQVAIRPVTGSETLGQAAAWLAAGPGRQVVGLVGDADGVIFQQRIERGSVRWMSSAHHAPGGGNRSGWEAAQGEGLGRIAQGRSGSGLSVSGAGPAIPLMSFVVQS